MGSPVIHWQIVTRNPERLSEFYCKLFGWNVNADNPLNYRMVDTGSERGIGGGIWPAPPEAPSFVQLHMEVADVTKSVEQAKQLGAKVIIPPQALPAGEMMAVMQDPEGVAFVLVRPK